MADCRKCQQFDSCYYDYDENCVGFLPSSPQELRREKQKAHANEILENYWKRKNSKLTNADHIRAMTDEELAQWVNFHTDCENCPNRGCEDPYSNPDFCVNSLLSWLKSPVEVDNGT